jgi:hypothetical protein
MTMSSINQVMKLLMNSRRGGSPKSAYRADKKRFKSAAKKIFGPLFV